MSEVADFVGMLSGIAIIIGVLVALHTMREDHRRRKAQGFVEYYRGISWRLAKLRASIEKYYSEHGNDINPKDDSYSTIHKDVEKYLNYMEDLAVAINNDVYDFNIYAHCEGRTVVDFYRLLEPVIKYQRKDEKNHICRDYLILIEDTKKWLAKKKL